MCIFINCNENCNSMGETKNDFPRRCREVYLAYRINCMPRGQSL